MGNLYFTSQEGDLSLRIAVAATQTCGGYEYVDGCSQTNYVGTMEAAAQTPNSDLGLDKESSMESATQTLNSDLGLCTDSDNLNSKVVSLEGEIGKLSRHNVKLLSQMEKCASSKNTSAGILGSLLT